MQNSVCVCFFFSSRRRHTRYWRDWSSDVCSSDLLHFDELADLYELDGAIVHRVLAYRNAAKAIRDAPASVEEMTRAGTVTELRGIGKTIEEKDRKSVV